MPYGSGCVSLLMRGVMSKNTFLRTTVAVCLFFVLLRGASMGHCDCLILFEASMPVLNCVRACVPSCCARRLAPANELDVLGRGEEADQGNRAAQDLQEDRCAVRHSRRGEEFCKTKTFAIGCWYLEEYPILWRTSLRPVIGDDIEHHPSLHLAACLGD